MGDWGYKEAKAGSNTDTGTADKNLVYNTKYKHLIVRGKGKATSTSFDYAHGLGYKPIFDGYMLTDSKYFLNYFQAPVDGGSFENTLYGNIFTDATNLNANCATANRLIYLCYLNPAGSIASITSPASIGDWGIKMSPDGIDVKTCDDGELSLTSKYQSPLIIGSGSISVSVEAIGPTSMGTTIIRKTNYTDVTHGRSQANHVIIPEAFGSGVLAFYPAPIGLTAPYVVTDVEIYIDASKIRVRVSRMAVHDDIIDISAQADATTYTVKYYLTNIVLPT
jgi:hypothetical protein